MTSLISPRDSLTIRNSLHRDFWSFTAQHNSLPTRQRPRSHTPSGMADNSINDLREKVQSLPPELFNQVRDEVMKCESLESKLECLTCGPLFHIDQLFRYPKLLHINKHYRRTVAMKLFAATSLRFSSIDVFNRFDDTLDPKFLELVDCFMLVYFDYRAGVETCQLTRFFNYTTKKGVPSKSTWLSWPHGQGLVVDGKPVAGCLVFQNWEELEMTD